MTAIILENLLSPAVLFFSLGLLAAIFNNPLKLPEAISQGLTLFLLIAIGFKGGMVVAEQGLAA
ncbi:MAG: sodium-dependent bicarbonate transport family permease, partial [Salinisphaeraceae bacterium]|nr:sodium-dependent bicarbonate transport family permease [Salinisphaeraceae bacterium]